MMSARSPWSRPRLAVNPTELLTWWEERRRPISLRVIARKLGISKTTTHQRLQELCDAGQVDDKARARVLAPRGGLQRGGNRLAADVLTAAWAVACRRALRLLGPPHPARSRVRTRLQEIGLLKEDEFLLTATQRR